MLDETDATRDTGTMIGRMLIFGMGYTASHLAACLRAEGWQVQGTSRQIKAGTLAFDDTAGVALAIAQATHVLSSVPPDKEGRDPVLSIYGDALRKASPHWMGYFSSTGVYGDTNGAWVDESAAIGRGRRTARADADFQWQALSADARIFRLPGIYGPGRSALERVRSGTAHRIIAPEQVFSRIHVDDIVSGVRASFARPAGVYNLADDRPCDQNQVITAASALLGIAPPPLITMEAAQLSPMVRAFYSENRRVANGKAKRLLGWKPVYPDYRAGLVDCMATNSPAITNTAPEMAKDVQR
jgi:hypothetical protein